MRFSFCPDCGKRLSARDLGDELNVPWCDGCGKPWFEMFPCCVIVLARRQGKYALIKQNSCEKSERDKFVCVSGYIKTGESGKQAAIREVKEELGLDVLSCSLVSTYVYNKKQMLMLGYAADVSEGEFQLSDELCGAQWFDVEQTVELLGKTTVGDELIKGILSKGL